MLEWLTGAIVSALDPWNVERVTRPYRPRHVSFPPPLSPLSPPIGRNECK